MSERHLGWGPNATLRGVILSCARTEERQETLWNKLWLFLPEFSHCLVANVYRPCLALSFLTSDTYNNNI